VSEPHIPALQADLIMYDQERDNLVDSLESVRVNPYRSYEEFCIEIHKISESAATPSRLREYAAQRRTQSAADNPTGLIKNTPIDSSLPVFDHDEPVLSKRALKTTFVAEGFLTLYAELAGTPGISYENANDGDVFHDIYPQLGTADNLPQKTLGPIFFHRDLVNHFVRPDYLYMLGMRSAGANAVYTAFASNKDVIARLDAATLAVARQARFQTPFEPPVHSLVSDAWYLRISENRTEGLDSEAECALREVVNAIHAVKRGIDIQPGDFVTICNNYCVHNREFGEVVDLGQLATRWLIKTMNVDSRAPHSPHFVDGVPYMVRSEPGDTGADRTC
jgi:L-asparagine oxygenase